VAAEDRIRHIFRLFAVFTSLQEIAIMSLAAQLTEYISACFTGVWVVSHEHDGALAEIAAMCRQENWRLAVWDVERGLQIPGQASGQSQDTGGGDPLAAIRSLGTLAVPDGSAILVLLNFHRFMQSAEVVQSLAQQIGAGKNRRTFVLILSPIVAIPTELEKLMVVVEHELPDRAQLEEIARGVATQEGELPESGALNTVLDASAGLTRFEAEGAFSLSLIRHGYLAADRIWELKSQTLKKSGLLQLHRAGNVSRPWAGSRPSRRSVFARCVARAAPTRSSDPKDRSCFRRPAAGKVDSASVWESNAADPR
jgi:hypothetical protein